MRGAQSLPRSFPTSHSPALLLTCPSFSGSLQIPPRDGHPGRLASGWDTPLQRTFTAESRAHAGRITLVTESPVGYC